MKLKSALVCHIKENPVYLMQKVMICQILMPFVTLCAFVFLGFNEEAKKRKGGGGVSFVKTLLCAGALCLAAKCFSWLRSWWNLDLNENILKAIPWRPPSDQHPHIMLDYVY